VSSHAWEAGRHLLLNFYYLLKPFIPEGTRFLLRHCCALPVKWALAGSWPIRAASSGVPEAWPGWPHGKSFACVLTHDVERRKGLARCRALAEMEMRLGFRSAFNFVPEGDYETPEELRMFLTEHGFEVGVHDLHHDGSLYHSFTSFKEKARKINQYLRAWNASGFRSGFMRHDHRWLQHLDVEYDASTFEYDPFEPQPDGAGTIFPFWVHRDDGSAYVELPYTLPQDSTLFLVLRERGNDTWKRKLEWVASRGGMAMLIVHPDYLSFDEPASTEYRAELYEDFLVHVRSRYGDRAWFAQPRDVAAHVRRYLPCQRVTSSPSTHSHGTTPTVQRECL
jgi:hypothetical protein